MGDCCADEGVGGGRGDVEGLRDGGEVGGLEVEGVELFGFGGLVMRSSCRSRKTF